MIWGSPMTCRKPPFKWHLQQSNPFPCHLPLRFQAPEIKSCGSWGGFWPWIFRNHTGIFIAFPPIFLAFLGIFMGFSWGYGGKFVQPRKKKCASLRHFSNVGSSSRVALVIIQLWCPALNVAFKHGGSSVQFFAAKDGVCKRKNNQLQ